jgi:DNA-binding CsgD family transcriptional regulator
VRALGSSQRALGKIAALSAEPRSLVSFWDDAAEVLRSAVPHFSFPCWYTLDPATLLFTSHYNPQMPELPRESLALEYYGDDVNQIVDVARTVTGVSTMHEATGGDPTGSPRWQVNIQLGGDQELVAALRTRSGEAWAALGLYRGPGQPLFNDAEKRFVQDAAPHLAEGARRALLFGEATDPEGPQAPGLVVLASDWTIQSSSPDIERWLHDLPDGDLDAGKLPAAMLSVAGRALRPVGHGGPAEVAMARVLTRSGTWVVLHGVALQSGTDSRVAVIIEPAHPARITALLMSAYGLTDRERDVTRLVLQGASTTEIATELTVSPHTVQQHLKSIFDKTGVRSRRDLVGKIFFAHYEPRLRDNEQRTSHRKALRGGPLTPSQPVAARRASTRPEPQPRSSAHWP